MPLLPTQLLFFYSLAPVIIMLLKLLSKGHHDMPNPIAFFIVSNLLFLPGELDVAFSDLEYFEHPKSFSKIIDISPLFCKQKCATEVL